MSIDELMAKYGNASEALVEVDNSDDGINKIIQFIYKFLKKILVLE